MSVRIDCVRSVRIVQILTKNRVRWQFLIDSVYVTHLMGMAQERLSLRLLCVCDTVPAGDKYPVCAPGSTGRSWVSVACPFLLVLFRLMVRLACFGELVHAGVQVFLGVWGHCIISKHHKQPISDDRWFNSIQLHNINIITLCIHCRSRLYINWPFSYQSSEVE